GCEVRRSPPDVARANRKAPRCDEGTHQRSPEKAGGRGVIYVKRDAGIIPRQLLDKAVAAQDELERLPANKRAEHIKKNSKIWRDFKKYLSHMSYGKCWYSESPEAQSHLDVDHFRPKLEARRGEKVSDKPGYEWLAFSWDNFRLSAQLSNRPVRNEE